MTATVQIKTLTVAGKQVTLAVFRQLREELLIAHDASLNGTPWGVVNYHPDKCGDASAHWHVVWQRGEELLRSRVAEEPYFKPEMISGDADRWLTAHIRAWLVSDDAPPDYLPRDTSDLARGYTLGSEEWIGVEGFGQLKVFMQALPEANAAVKAYGARKEAQRRVDRAANLVQHPDSWRKPEDDEKALAAAQDASAAADDEFIVSLAALEQLVDAWGKSIDELRGNLLSAVAAEHQRRQRHREVNASMADLPQLFIAV